MGWSARLAVFTGRKDRVRLTSLVLAVVFLCAWWLISRGFSKIVLPSPIDVGRAFLDIAASGAILLHVSSTFYRVSLSFSISLALSLLLGYVVGRNRYLQEFFEKMVMFLQSIPSAIWIVMAIIWFGISDLSPIFIVAAIGFPVMALNVFEGVKNVDSDLIEMGEIFGHSEHSVFNSIVIPSIFPYLLTGARVTMALSWKISVIAEVLGATSGIGYAISYAWERLRTNEIFAWGLVLVIILQVFDYFIFRRLERRVRKYQTAI
jgi:NitT/TauT family transport system permease protein